MAGGYTQNLLIILFMILSVLLATIFGDDLTLGLTAVGKIYVMISNIVPSIDILAANSDFPVVTRNYLSLMWILLPVFTVVFFAKKNAVRINESALINHKFLYYCAVSLFVGVTFSLLYTLISHDLLAGASRDKYNKLVFLRKFIYLINTNRFALGLIMGALFSFLALFIAYLIRIVKMEFRRK